MKERIRILCVDDEPNVLKALERIFLDDEYTILTATSGARGLDILKSSSPVQLVISDYRMPEMNGVEFLKQVRASWPDTVRIVLSGYADTASVLAAINEGQVYKFIPKPWNDDELKVAVANAIERYQLHRNNTELAGHLTKKSEEYRNLNATLQWLITEKASEMTFQSKVFEYFQTIFQALPAAVFCINAAGYVIQTNRKAKEFLSAVGLQVSGARRETVFPEEWNRFIDAVFEQKARSGRLTINNATVVAKGAFVTFSNDEKGVVLVIDADGA